MVIMTIQQANGDSRPETGPAQPSGALDLLNWMLLTSLVFAQEFLHF